jgi:hypothetical protein
VYAINLDYFNEIIHLGETNEDGELILQLNKNNNYGYLRIEYVGRVRYYITIKEKKNINKIIKLHSSEPINFIE